jgi:hypothetical protein
VIKAFNENLPWDQFTLWQVAGDLLPHATDEQLLATAFSRLHQQENEGGSVEEEYRVNYVNDRVTTFGTAFLGLTLECCRCHDHKFDPLSQKEFYQLFAFFDDVDEAGLYSFFTEAVPTPKLRLLDDATVTTLAKADEACGEAATDLGEAEAVARATVASWIAGTAPLPAALEAAGGMIPLTGNLAFGVCTQEFSAGAIGGRCTAEGTPCEAPGTLCLDTGAGATCVLACREGFDDCTNDPGTTCNVGSLNPDVVPVFLGLCL